MSRFQYILIGFLVLMVLLNIFLLVFIWHGRPFHTGDHFGRRHRTGSFLENKLELSSLQKRQFREIQVEHMSNMEELNLEIRLLNRDLHTAILKDDSLGEMFVNKQIDSLHFLMKKETTQHIRNISLLLDSGQKGRLLEALNELPDRFGHRGHQRRGHRNESRRRGGN